jgi:hypothetical protein
MLMNIDVDPSTERKELEEKGLSLLRIRLGHTLFNKNLNQKPVAFSRDDRIIEMVDKKKFQMVYKQFIQLESISNSQISKDGSRLSYVPEIFYKKMMQHENSLLCEVEIQTKKASNTQSINDVPDNFRHTEGAVNITG